MKPTLYKIGEGEWKLLSKDMQEIILAYQEESKRLEEENKKLKESLDIATKCSSKEEDGIIRLSEENKKLKAELEIYKKQYKHTMGGDYIDEDLYDLDC